MIVVFFIAAFLFKRKSEDENYSTLIWLSLKFKLILNLMAQNVFLCGGGSET